MIHFKKLSIKNFLSFGNIPSVIELDKVSKTAIFGTNGFGKCLDKNTLVTIRNKNTLELFTVSLGELYEYAK